MAQEIKGLVRLANTDIKGDKPVFYGLTKIHGVGINFSNAICQALNLDKQEKIGSLDDKKLREIEDAINNPASRNIPAWIFNRKIDPDSGQSMHLNGPKLKLTQEFDLRRMKKIKSYKGVRHILGLPVRGQRTKGNFRRGASVGVMKKAAAAAQQAAKAETGKEKKGK